MREAILEKETNYYTEDFVQLLEQSFSQGYKTAELVEGTVIKMEKSSILIDIGGKTEAMLPLRELSNLPFEKPEDVISVGDKRKFYILREENDEGQITVSLRRVHLAQNWEKLDQMRQNEEIIKVKITSLVKGGVIVDALELKGFIPASQLRTGVPHESLIDQELSVRVLEADPKRNKLILSEKLCLAEERKKIAKDVIAQLEENQEIEGEVVRLADFGAFIDIMGIDGLLPISEISWQRIKHPSDILSLGQRVTVRVLNIDNELNRVSLSFKRMEENPWVKIEGKFEEGQVVKGTVNKITNFGAFINIFPGVEALLPVAEIADGRVNPYDFLNINQEVEVLIKRFSPQERRIGLSLKDLNSPNLELMSNSEEPASENQY
ncbi:MAG TPA: S1 RNA-binding domain-containing protein [Candidatus Gastranaerophilales bacterium]|nr:S1 RNA-binding domain-containing protein [Candidatus Gastranaerophilales bacterium]